MILNRLPTEAELDDVGVEAHTFLDAFQQNSTTPFVAEVEKIEGGVKLDGWAISQEEWFRVED